MKKTRFVIRISRFSLSIDFTMILLIMLTFEGPIAYEVKQGSIFAWGIRTVMSLCFAALCLKYIYFNSYRKKRYSVVLTVVFTMCLICSGIQILLHGVEWGIQDGFIMFGLFGGAWLYSCSMDKIEKILLAIAIFGTVRVLFILGTGQINWNIVMTRGYGWSEIFYWSTIFWAIIPFVIVCAVKRANYWTAIAFWICGLLNELLFLKRYIIADSLVLAAVILFYLYKNNARSAMGLLKISGLVAILIVVFIVILSNSNINRAFDAVFARLEKAYINILDFDRFRESRNYFSSASLIDVLLGRGFWSGHSSLLNLNPALHVGWLNFVFKGGVLCLLIVFIPTIKACRYFYHIDRFDESSQIAICYLIIYAVRLIYVNCFSFQPELLFLSWSCIIVMDNLRLRDGRLV